MDRNLTKKYTVAVTGGGGFIGSALVADLAQQPSIDRIYVLDLNPPNTYSDKISFLQCDLRSTIDVAPDQHVDHCFHLAGIAREPGFEWDEYFTGNYLIARNIAEWAAKNDILNIVFTSTAMVFCAADNRRAEEDLPNPNTAYGISKALAEEVLRAWRVQKPGRRLRIVRPGVVFGKGCGGNFVNLYKALRRNAFCYVGRDSTVKSNIYIKDLIRLLQVLATDQSSSDIYHGVYPQETTIKDVCTAFCAAFGWRRYIPTLPYKSCLTLAAVFEFFNFIGVKNPVHRRRIQKLYYSTNLSSNNLERIGFSPKYDLTSAVIDWHRECGNNTLY